MRYLLIVMILLAATSCKKEEVESQSSRTYMDVELKNSFSYTQGSYWVYQDQSMNVDSVILSNSKTGFTGTCPDNACTHYEYIELTFENVSKGYEFNHYLMLDFVRYNGGGSFGSEGQPIYLLNSNQGSAFNGLLVGEKFDSLTVLNEVYYNVEKMTVVADMQFQDEFDFDIDFYFVPTIGIVRTVIHDTTNGSITWDLKNYSIQ
ncbi:MAG: hypothetical protein WED33_10345 [Bacteroidia bacterium]